MQNLQEGSTHTYDKKKTPKINLLGKIKWQNQKLKHIKPMDSNCHTPELLQAFSHVENGGLNLVLEPLTFMSHI